MSTVLGNRYALHAMRIRRAELTGEIGDLESKLRHLRTSAKHLDATLAMMSRDDYDPASIRAIRPRRKAKLFGKGKLNAHVLDALRKADRPMTTREVTSAIAAALELPAEAEKGIKDRVRSALLYLSKVRGTVVKEGEWHAATWALQKDGANG